MYSRHDVPKDFTLFIIELVFVCGFRLVLLDIHNAQPRELAGSAVFVIPSTRLRTTSTSQGDSESVDRIKRHPRLGGSQPS